MSNDEFYKKEQLSRPPESVIYNKSHNVEVFYDEGLIEFKTVYITLTSFRDNVIIKIREVNNYCFNYETNIDPYTFEKMKAEQSLEINFEDIPLQISELLKDTLSKETFIKLEISSGRCRLVFYGKSKIKCIIFLVIDFRLTDPRDIINEMSTNIFDLKDKNNHLSKEINILRKEINTRDAIIKDIYSKKTLLEKEFYKQLDNIYNIVTTEQIKIENLLNSEILKLSKRVQKIFFQIETVKTENILKNETNDQLMRNIENLKLENQRCSLTISKLRCELQELNAAKVTIENNHTELERKIDQKDRKIESLEKQVEELQRDMKEATKIITKKTQVNDEIAKDLVQANQMLVNFNFHYDKMSKELDEVKEQLKSKDEAIEKLQDELDSLQREFSNYKSVYNGEEATKMKRQLISANERISELEKQNREALMLNNVLTKKLSSIDVLENHGSNAFSRM